jgi:hypothetical protein
MKKPFGKNSSSCKNGACKATTTCLIAARFNQFVLEFRLEQSDLFSKIGSISILREKIYAPQPKAGEDIFLT